MTLITTPLTAIHKNLGARLAPFAGWEMPIQYEGIMAEHNHTRSWACLFDICHMGEILVYGRNSASELGTLVTHDLEKAVPGKCSYGFMLTPAGTIRDDLIIYPLEPDRFMLVVNASRKQADLEHLKNNLSSGVRVSDMTMSTGKLDLQGPDSLKVLEEVIPGNWADLKYFHFTKTSLDGQELVISRTGYTGELGYEIYTPWDGVEALWNLILKDERVKPAGLGARDTLRLEAGLPLYGHELDENHTPAEGGYGFVLKSSARFMGKDKARVVNEQLTGLLIQGRRAARQGDLVLAGDKAVGKVTSGSFAPSLGHCVALAYIDKEYAGLSSFNIQRDKGALQAVKSDLPFYKGTARMNTSSKAP